MTTLLERVDYGKALWFRTFANHKLDMPDDVFFIRAKRNEQWPVQ
jgi:hypothetical protein